MNKCCINCPHRKISSELKAEFNRLVNKVFYECPLNDEKIFGCTVKYMNIDWVSFMEYLEENVSG